MDLLQRYQLLAKKYFTDGKKLLIGVSGGLDSVVLADLSHKAGLDFAIAHCNFQLRGEESERDENFVKDLASGYGRLFHLKKIDTKVFAAGNRCSIQEAARTIRYSWFAELEKEFDYDLTAVAHHADDNIETLLMNFFRGTGLKGLTGIPQVNVSGVHIVRPLLEFRRQELAEYAKQNQLKWVEDSSNASSDYTRNLFRNEILPLIKKAYPEAEENLLRNISRFQKISETYQFYVYGIKETLLQPLPSGEIHVPFIKLLRYQHTSVLYEIFSQFGFGEKQVNEIMNLAGSGSGKYIANEKWQVIRHRKMLVIAPVTKDSGMIAIEEGEKQIIFTGGKLDVELVQAAGHTISGDPHVAQLDASFISWPLILRRWKPGDYFYPLGLRKKKKLARFFIDQKLSKAQKENAWVLESGQRIIWVVGMRIDDRVKVTPNTKNLLLVTLRTQYR